MATFQKPFLEIAQQIDLLKQRGMTITDDLKAGELLARLGYYRLSGYWYPMRQSAATTLPQGRAVRTILDQFRPGVSFEQVTSLYVFDKRLRLLLLDAIERVEVALRVTIATRLGRNNPYAHMDKALLHGNFAKKSKYPDGETEHDVWRERYRRCVKRSSEDFIKHFKTKYPSQGLPIWIAVEVWDFGLTSTFFKGMTHADQTAIAAQYGLPRAELLAGWIRALNETRNACAHHSRVWNKPLINLPTPPKLGESLLLDHITGNISAQTRVYIIATALQFLVKTINPSSTWAHRLKDLFQSFPQAPGISPIQSGFPPKWEALPLWN